MRLFIVVSFSIRKKVLITLLVKADGHSDSHADSHADSEADGEADGCQVLRKTPRGLVRGILSGKLEEWRLAARLEQLGMCKVSD
jgi:hypothetical protein